jgi:sarcosine oxidase subunit beta
MASGITFQLETEVIGITTNQEHVTGVKTSSGAISSPLVLVAAGAWANHLFKPLHIDLGLKPHLAQVVVFRWTMESNGPHMTYIDRINAMWTRPIDSNCFLVGIPSYPIEDPDTYSEIGSEDAMNTYRAQLIKRFPSMRGCAMRGSWSGLIMKSPDGKPIIGAIPNVHGLYTLAGDSGSCFKSSPIIGRSLAELMTEGKTTVDITPFRPERFADGRLWLDPYNYGKN